MELILIYILFWGIFAGVTAITWLIYIVKGFTIAPWSYLDRYPFVCYKCMTTWTLIVCYIMAGLLLSDYTFIAMGIALSALHGYGMDKLEKERKLDNDN